MPSRPPPKDLLMSPFWEGIDVGGMWENANEGTARVELDVAPVRAAQPRLLQSVKTTAARNQSNDPSQLWCRALQHLHDDSALSQEDKEAVAAAVIFIANDCAEVSASPEVLTEIKDLNLVETMRAALSQVAGRAIDVHLVEPAETFNQRLQRRRIDENRKNKRREQEQLLDAMAAMSRQIHQRLRGRTFRSRTEYDQEFLRQRRTWLQEQGLDFG
jgi:hypothetical protein